MANTYTQLYAQLVFAVKGRQSLILKEHRERIHQYITGIVQNRDSIFIKENKLTPFKFEWQDGYGAFTYAQSQINTVCQYVLNQEEHHKAKTFREEYVDFLNKFEVPYDERYMFEWLEE